MQGVVSLWKPAYYGKDKRRQSGLESDSDSVILTKEKGLWSELKITEFAYNT